MHNLKLVVKMSLQKKYFTFWWCSYSWVTSYYVTIKAKLNERISFFLLIFSAMDNYLFAAVLYMFCYCYIHWYI